LHFALLALTGTGDEVLVPNPGSPSYAELARIAGTTPVGYPLHAEAGFLPDVDEITSLITSRTRVLVLNSPHNPTGTLLPESLLTRLFEVANDRRLYVVVDEAHRELTGGVSALTAAAAHDRTIVMTRCPDATPALPSFRVTWPTTWRCGSPTAWRASECSSTACVERGHVTEDRLTGPAVWSRTENGSAARSIRPLGTTRPSGWCGRAGQARTPGAPARLFCCRRANMSVTPASSMAFATTGDEVTAMWAPRARQASRALSRTCTPATPKNVTSPRSNTTSGVVISGKVTHFSSSGAVRRST
jgi:hypothetical protein